MTTKETTAADFESEIAALRKDLAALRDDVAKTARTAVLAASNGTAQVGQAVRHKADELVEKGSDIASSVGRHIEEQPLASVAIAFGAGFLLSTLLVRHGARDAPAHGMHNGS